MASSNDTRPLTDLAIKRLKPGTVIADVGENRGLRVSRGKTGVTAFIYRFRSPIKNESGDAPIRQVKIGTYPEISLNEARVELVKLKAKRDSGICPASNKKSEREALIKRELTAKEAAKQEAFTVEACIEKYLSEHIETKKREGKVVREGARQLKGQRETRRILYSDPVGRLGDISVTGLTSEAVIEMVMGVVDRGSNVVAGSMLRELTAAIDYSIGSDLPSSFQNPCYQAKAILKRKRVRLSSERGRRVLNDSELAALLRWLPASSYTQTQKNILLFTLMTGCRTGEVCAAMWKDINLKAGTWHLSETKTGSERYVQLSRQAIAFLEQLKRTTGDCLFPSQKTGLSIQQKQLTEQAWRMRQAGTFIDLPQWSPHDLRRSVRTGLSRMGCPSEVGEAVLGHARGGIEGTYDLHRYESECRMWLQRWCDHLDELATSDKVVDMGVGRES